MPQSKDMGTPIRTLEDLFLVECHPLRKSRPRPDRDPKLRGASSEEFRRGESKSTEGLYKPCKGMAKPVYQVYKSIYGLCLNKGYTKPLRGWPKLVYQVHK